MNVGVGRVRLGQLSGGSWWCALVVDFEELQVQAVEEAAFFFLLVLLPWWSKWRRNKTKIRRWGSSQPDDYPETGHFFFFLE